MSNLSSSAPLSGGQDEHRAPHLDPVEVLLAIEEIRNLKSRYFQAVDDKDWEAMVDIFTDDAVVDFSGEAQYHVGHHGVAADAVAPDAGKAIGGREAARIIDRAIHDVVTVHHGHDPQIELTGRDSARGRWSMYDRLEYDGTEVMHGYGHYHEEYRRVNGCWRISALLLTRLRVVWATV